MTLRPKEYAFWPTPEDPEYGLLFCVDEEGKRWTLRGDPDLVRMLRDAGPEGRGELSIGGVWEQRKGWPDEPRRLVASVARCGRWLPRGRNID